MRYVDAGYVIALCVLLLYALSLVARRRRLARAQPFELSKSEPVPRGGGSADPTS